MANGASRAEPSATSAQPSGVPTTVSVAAAECAQPLAQPEMWIVCLRPMCRATASAITGAIVRAAICAEAQIVGADDKAELLRGGDKIGSRRTCQPDGHQRAARCSALTTCSSRASCVSQSFERGRMGMTKTQTDAANEQTAANWMYADCFAESG